MKRLRILLLLAGILAGTDASAQFFQTGSDPFGQWSQMGTEHYRIVYPKGLDSLARAYVIDLERWQPLVGQSAGMAPGSRQWGRTPVVLHPWNPYSNGSVAWAPKRMDLYTHPEAYGSIPQSWMTQLTVHESRHVSQMQLAYRKPFRWVNYLVGEMWPGAVTAFYAPPTLLEGDAVVAETALTASGRGRTADFLNYYHVAFDNGDWRDWYKWVYGSFKKAGPDYYTVGYMTVGGMRYFYDQPSFTADYFDYVTKHPFPVAKLQRYMRRVSGKSFKKTWQGIMEGFHDIWTEEAEERGPFMEMERVSREHAFATDYSNGSWIDESEYFAIKKAKDQATRLVRIEKGGREIDMGAFSSNTSSLNPGKHRMFWSETIPGKRWTLDGESIIRSLERSGRRRDLTTEGRLYNPQPGPGGIATVEYPVEGGSNLVLIDEDDGHLLRRVPAPAGIQLADPAWVDSTIYCLGLDDRGFGIWRLDDHTWTCVLEPTPQTMENLEGENHVLDFVSDRNGVKELYRYDPATGRAWQLTNSRYGGTDYFWHGDTLWFNSMTPEGTAIFKAKAPEPKEVDIKEVHKYRVAERLSEQEIPGQAGNDVMGQAGNDVMGQAGNDGTGRHGRPDRPSVSEPKPYRKALNLIKFHSWAPVYFNYDAVESMSADFSYDTASPGLTGMFQNDLGTAWGTVGYSVHPDPEKDAEWRHSGHLQFTYSGLYPVLEASFDLYDTGASQYHFERRDYGGKNGYASVRQSVDGPSWTGSIKAYIPFRYNKSGWHRGWVPQVSWGVSNSRFDNGEMVLKMTEDFVSEKTHAAFTSFQHGQNVLMQTLRGSVRGYWTLPTAESQVYPRWGIGVETGGSFRPGLDKIYSPVWYSYLYGYLPGFTRTQGLRLTASTQYQIPTGAPFGENSISIAPRGFTSADARAIARKSAAQIKLTADYAIPIYVGDISWFSPVAYISHFLLIPHVDWTGFGLPRNGKGTPANSSLVSAGADFTVELGNFFWAPFPCSLGVSASWLGGPYFKTLAEADEEGRKPWYVGLVFSLDI